MRNKVTNIRVSRIKNSKSKLIKASGTTTGEITATIPKIIKILKIVVPITLPKEISVFFLIKAAMEVSISGEAVPRVTKVMPMTISLTLKYLAKLTPEVTKNLAPKISSNKLKIR